MVLGGARALRRWHRRERWQREGAGPSAALACDPPTHPSTHPSIHQGWCWTVRHHTLRLWCRLRGAAMHAPPSTHTHQCTRGHASLLQTKQVANFGANWHRAPSPPHTRHQPLKPRTFSSTAPYCLACCAASPTAASQDSTHPGMDATLPLSSLYVYPPTMQSGHCPLVSLPTTNQQVPRAPPTHVLWLLCDHCHVTPQLLSLLQRGWRRLGCGCRLVAAAPMWQDGLARARWHRSQPDHLCPAQAQPRP